MAVARFHQVLRSYYLVWGWWLLWYLGRLVLSGLLASWSFCVVPFEFSPTQPML